MSNLYEIKNYAINNAEILTWYYQANIFDMLEHDDIFTRARVGVYKGEIYTCQVFTVFQVVIQWGGCVW